MSNRRRGLLFIVSAPSGAGKTTLVERLVEQVPHLRMSRSYTSRAGAGRARLDGVDYNFVTRDRVRGDGRGRRVPGVGRRLRQPLRDLRRRHRARCSTAGDDVVLVIDVQGARKVRARGLRDHDDVRDAAVLRGARAAAARPQQGQRGGDPAAAAGGARRGGRASREYDFVVVNDELTAAVDRLRGIVVAERARAAADAGRKPKP